MTAIDVGLPGFPMIQFCNPVDEVEKYYLSQDCKVERTGEEYPLLSISGEESGSLIAWESYHSWADDDSKSYNEEEVAGILLRYYF